MGNSQLWFTVELWGLGWDSLPHPLFSFGLPGLVVGMGFGEWLECRPVKQQLVSAWVRTPSPTGDHFHSPPVV